MTSPYRAKATYQDQEVASVYDRVRFRGLRGALIDRLEQRLLMRAIDGLSPDGAGVLDLPVGTGRMARRLVAAGYRVIGADISEPMLRIALELSTASGGRSGLVRADGEALPIADKSVDGAVCFRLMPHLPADARMRLLREMARVARRRVIAVYQPHRLSLWGLVNRLLGRRLPLYYVSPRELQREFEQSGLRLLRSHALLPGILMQRAYVLEHLEGTRGRPAQA